MPLPQALLTVTAPVETGIPAPMAACRAGHCFRPAGRTQPRNTSSTSAPSTALRARASRTAVLPSSVAGTLLRLPMRPPMGVRAPSTMMTFSRSAFVAMAVSVLSLCGARRVGGAARRRGCGVDRWTAAEWRAI